MRYLSAEEIVAIHDRIIEETQGSFGVRDEHLLRSIAEKPKASFGGTEQFPTLFLKAAAYLESVATYHVFVDGNKRTAITVASSFLGLNGYDVVLPLDETETFVLAVAQRHIQLVEIATWLEKNSQKE
jgi:death-on-curing protein